MAVGTKLHKKGQIKKYLSFFWRSYTIQSVWNYEGQMNLGFLYGIAPTLDRLYNSGSEEDLQKKKEAYKRHLAFYNCTPQTSAFVLGLASSMEEEYAKNPSSFDPSSINAVKASLMGPLSGVGDSFFQGTIKVLAFGLGVNFARQGSILGPILALVLSFVPAALVTYYGGKLGYTAGNNFIQKLTREGIMDRAMYLVTIVGLMVIGSMIASMIGITTPLHVGKAFSLQKTLDSIFPQMLSLAATFSMYYLLHKKVSTGWILTICIVSGLLFSVLGLLS
ncbi:PTS system mannose/fructose/sorbose family transporter subunit IID [Pediococcus acidilactici]|uniref:PTS system mannose/fructose/sorbose family transporter subunit IID n=1 Tax=Pediococcus acidilactici TaxID=1254 RepID=UPI00140FEAE3|nr:PTS system mannose/fructose/sorbose family transporter subunit IID [Pediococcus acidilactici]QIO84633.1 PTS system mannose/fructose/sorbose family transporter subunit IID [Pediococcus acidilactici]QJW86099.1 PTS system mannose/fructose/sorbose family transporter subunit IID [Pediococcus acidilactici]QYI94947.1 PTS system mannose/fructose/sorbose family transporter subunit IID [Pediococcus acidilactici]